MVLLATPVVAGLLAYFLPLIEAEKNSEVTYAAMTATDFSCPQDYRVEIENWGNDGYARFCSLEGVKEGDWQAWQEGFLNIEGGFLAGEEEGEWLIYNEQGQLIRRVEYRAGKVESDEQLAES